MDSREGPQKPSLLVNSIRTSYQLDECWTNSLIGKAQGWPSLSGAKEVPSEMSFAYIFKFNIKLFLCDRYIWYVMHSAIPSPCDFSNSNFFETLNYRPFAAAT